MRLFDRFSKNSKLFWPECLYVPMISHFLFRIFISKYIASASVFSLYQFSYLDAILSLTYKQRPPAKQFLSSPNILYPYIKNWQLGKELSIFVSEIRKMSNVSSIIFSIVSNLFLSELMFRWPRIKFFGLFRRTCLSFVKQLFMLSEVFWITFVSLDIPLRMSAKLLFSIIRVQQGPLHIHCMKSFWEKQHVGSWTRRNLRWEKVCY